MKKLYRIISLTVIAVMLLSLTALADTSYSWEDNFNRYTADSTVTSGSYPGGTDTSDVFAAASSAGGYAISTDKGTDGSGVLRLPHNGSNDVVLLTKDIGTTLSGMSDSAVVEFVYDICIESNQTAFNADDARYYVAIGGRNNTGGGYLFYLSQDGDDWIFKTNANTNGASYTVSTWYKVIIRRTKDTRYGWITDQEGNVLAEASEARTVSSGEIICAAKVPARGKGAGLIIDNASINIYDFEADAPSCTSSSVKNGDDAVLRNASFTFVFDHEITSDSEIVLTKADGSSVEGVTVSTKKTLFNTLTLTIDGLLDRKTDYRISFADVSNGALTCADEDIVFTTEDLHIWDDIEVISAEEAQGNTKVAFQINDVFGYSTFTGKVMAMAYIDGAMTGADIVSLTDAKVGESLMQTFDLGAVTSDTEIQLALIDTTNSVIIPIASGLLTK